MRMPAATILFALAATTLPSGCGQPAVNDEPADAPRLLLPEIAPIDPDRGYLYVMKRMPNSPGDAHRPDGTVRETWPHVRIELTARELESVCRIVSTPESYGTGGILLTYKEAYAFCLYRGDEFVLSVSVNLTGRSLRILPHYVPHGVPSLRGWRAVNGMVFGILDRTGAWADLPAETVKELRDLVRNEPLESQSLSADEFESLLRPPDLSPGLRLFDDEEQE